MKEKENVPVEVFTGTTWEANLVKSILEDQGIITFVQNEAMSVIQPFNTLQGGFGSTTLLVPETSRTAAEAIIEEIKFD